MTATAARAVFNTANTPVSPRVATVAAKKVINTKIATSGAPLPKPLGAPTAPGPANQLILTPQLQMKMENLSLNSHIIINESTNTMQILDLSQGPAGVYYTNGVSKLTKLPAPTAASSKTPAFKGLGKSNHHWWDTLFDVLKVVAVVVIVAAAIYFTGGAALGAMGTAAAAAGSAVETGAAWLAANAGVVGTVLATSAKVYESHMEKEASEKQSQIAQANMAAQQAAAQRQAAAAQTSANNAAQQQAYEQQTQNQVLQATINSNAMAMGATPAMQAQMAAQGITITSDGGQDLLTSAGQQAQAQLGAANNWSVTAPNGTVIPIPSYTPWIIAGGVLFLFLTN